jgi:nicotinamidase-related amidase
VIDAAENTARRHRIPASAVHLCLDMQNLIGPAGPWAARWAERILPAVVRLVEHAPHRCIFTRFVPPAEPTDLPACWRSFYRAWPGLTAREIDPNAIALMAPLQIFTPPAQVLDKTRFSAFSNPALHAALQSMAAETVIISGAETDMCVLATALAAIDFGYHVIVATDAVCSSADPGHEAAVRLYRDRFSQQMQALETAEIRAAWQAAPPD